MALVDYPDVESVPPAVRERLEAFEETNDRFSSVQLALASNPEAFAAFDDFFGAVMLGGAIDQRTKQLAHVAVSLSNDCEYCIASHAENLLVEHDLDPGILDAIAAGDVDALDPRDRAVVRLAVRMTEDPKRVTAAHLEALLDNGFTEEMFLELVLLIAQANLANTIVDTLNVHPADHDEALTEYLLDRPA